ncbi:hypothetical protein FQR65_LT17329 [Abscondita terminalis]|nr:hypothetical protein FQR65_LT17329 [Abscondita terminalis]
MPMLYMDDAINATLQLMDAPADKLSVRTSYNLGGMSFTPAELAAEIKNEIPEFQIDYEPDFRQIIADSWPASIDDSVAKKDWGLKYDFDILLWTKDMIENLKKKAEKGNNYHVFTEKMGRHAWWKSKRVYTSVYYFAVWAPNAKRVAVVGDFNNWKAAIHELKYRWDNSGIWAGLYSKYRFRNIYKYEIETYNGHIYKKPILLLTIAEIPHQTASVVSTTWYEWGLGME